MHRVFLAVAILVVALLAAPVSIAGEPRVKLHPTTPVSVTEGAPVDAKIKAKDASSSVGWLCIGLAFDGDLLDPGETILVDMGPEFGGFGATNVASQSIASRDLCTAQPEQLEAFSAGQVRVSITVESGSVTIASAWITVGP
jgi:hypothetical protein